MVLQVRRRERDQNGDVHGRVVQNGLSQDATNCAKTITKNLYSTMRNKQRWTSQPSVTTLIIEQRLTT
jgi:hypothetical protein